MLIIIKKKKLAHYKMEFNIKEYILIKSIEIYSNFMTFELQIQTIK